MATKDDSWIERSDVLSLFPTFVWNIEIKTDLSQTLNAEILAVLHTLRQPLPPLEPGEAWQSHQELHKLDELVGLVSCIHGTVRRILRFLRIGYEAFEITACWASISTPGTRHGMHTHPNNFLSGVYYLQTQPGADTINFHDPRVQTSIIRPPVTELTAQNTDQVVVRVRNGTLLVFPSYLQHSVDPNRSEKERISLSFNIMFSSFTENLSKPLW
jgi:uncharacterized protein (TIGR02466 family)